MKYQRSSKLFVEAKQYIPGGVNSPVRAFKAVGGDPVFFKQAKGAYLFDEDNNKYVDYINSWGPMILGHANDEVIVQIIDQVRKGTSYGAPTELESKIAKVVVDNIEGIDKIRFVNSGTEACMSAVRLARGFTKRNKIIKFEGCYHGHSDTFLINAGSGAATFGSPSSPGVTPGTAQDTLSAKYNNLESVEALFNENPQEIAAIIVEPVAGNMGCISPNEGFLQGLRKLCDKHNALLIFDEVMTGFRLAFGGAQELFKVKADIVTYGKVVGGGMPVGAFAARNEIMDHLAPNGAIYQAGTLSGNPVAMAAGLATLEALLKNNDIYQSINDKTTTLNEGITKILTEAKIDFKINQVGSMISVFFTDEEVVDFESAKKADNDNFKKFFRGMLDKGFYLPPSSYETWFITEALSKEDIEATLTTVRQVVENMIQVEA